MWCHLWVMRLLLYRLSLCLWLCHPIPGWRTMWQRLTGHLSHVLHRTRHSGWWLLIHLWWHLTHWWTRMQLRPVLTAGWCHLMRRTMSHMRLTCCLWHARRNRVLHLRLGLWHRLLLSDHWIGWSNWLLPGRSGRTHYTILLRRRWLLLRLLLIRGIS